MEKKETEEKMEETAPRYYSTDGRPCPPGVRPDLITYDDVVDMAPIFKGHRKLVETIMRWLIIDKCNAVHSKYCYTSGLPFANLLIDDCYRIRKRIDNEEVLDRFPEGAFITVSNHPLGALDGIMLIDIVGRHRSDFKVMVNLFLNHITAMRPSFIAVDPSSSDDPDKKAVTMQGIREAMSRIKSGHPVGFFPAGAVSKVHRNLRVSDREWQPSIVKLIKQMKVPVIPIYFHDHNSAFFNILGMIDWRIRTLRLPRELFNKTGKEMHISVGEPIMPEEQAKYKSLEEFGAMIRERTYALRDMYK
ncbi:MAG: lysophospholipid acyltransferase family protein [Muribaculaceae bacterium]|nr:lysophospholipid acyltransferase family protein [Muribaculaceae bacterium]